jgi:hypothetical protein
MPSGFTRRDLKTRSCLKTFGSGRTPPHRSEQRLAQECATALQNCQSSLYESGCLGAGSPAVIGRGLRLAWDKSCFKFALFPLRFHWPRASVRHGLTAAGRWIRNVDPSYKVRRSFRGKIRPKESTGVASNRPTILAGPVVRIQLSALSADQKTPGIPLFQAIR